MEFRGGFGGWTRIQNDRHRKGRRFAVYGLWPYALRKTWNVLKWPSPSSAGFVEAVIKWSHHPDCPRPVPPLPTFM